jgi:hypothetical protein
MAEKGGTRNDRASFSTPQFGFRTLAALPAREISARALRYFLNSEKPGFS